MTKQARIILNNCSFQFEGSPVLFKDLSLSFEQKRYGIVGDNGVGKTTFIKILSGEFLPQQGSVQANGRIAVTPQSHSHILPSATIADVLGITHKLCALKRIHAGHCNEKDYDDIGEDWDIVERIKTSLTSYQLDLIKLDTLFAQLSGGQKIKVLLAKTLLFPADFILMDEPTNNLDQSSREVLYRFIDNCSNGLIIISHDRVLLNKMDCTIHMTMKKVNVYGGNFQFYQQQADLALQAQRCQHLDKKRTLKKTQVSIQKTREKHEQRQAKGKQQRQSGSQAKVIFDSMKARSEKTRSKISIQAERMMQNAQEQLHQIKENMEINYNIVASLDATQVANSKTVLEIKDLCFRYPSNSIFQINDFNLQIIGPERIALKGDNGCGKSTIVKLILQQLQPLHGTIKMGVEHIAYFDQAVSLLDKDLTLVENFLLHNPGSQSFDAYSALATFKFRNKDAEKRVKNLSGGEKMRAGLAISLMLKYPPQLIILDEPTNHLPIFTGSCLIMNQNSPIFKVRIF